MNLKEIFYEQLDELIDKYDDITWEYYYVYLDYYMNKFEIGDEYDGVFGITFDYGEIEKIPTDKSELRNQLVNTFNIVYNDLCYLSANIIPFVYNNIDKIIYDIRNHGELDNILSLDVVDNKELDWYITTHLNRFWLYVICSYSIDYFDVITDEELYDYIFIFFN